MKYYIFTILFMMISVGNAQGPLQFEGQVEAIQQKYNAILDTSQKTIVFTGSSSIRVWQDVQERFSDHAVVNTGFGGSQASDLLYYIYDLILRYHPKKVFIYEGDNDIAKNKTPNKVCNDLQQIISAIQRNDSTTQIVLIAVKPSIARWGLRRKYKRLNRKMERVAEGNPLVEYANVWAPMLNGNSVKRDIFVEDGLHMNDQGYEIWHNVLKPFVN
ncbi:MAG: GDSL-type esterase/lipase family protein [Sediminicola sp.]